MEKLDTRKIYNYIHRQKGKECGYFGRSSITAERQRFIQHNADRYGQHQRRKHVREAIIGADPDGFVVLPYSSTCLQHSQYQYKGEKKFCRKDVCYITV